MIDPDFQHLDPGAYRPVLEEVAARYPNLAVVAATLRVARTASRNDWGAVAIADGTFHQATLRPDLDILDRIGGGDSFASGLIYGLLAGKPVGEALEYGAAHGALAMTTPGDTSMASLEEVERLVRGGGARVSPMSRALLLVEPGRFAWGEVPEPVAAQGEVVVRARFSGLCGTDLHIADGSHPRATLPLAIGHEFVGVPESGRLAGRTVLVDPLLPCGACAACDIGASNACARLRLIGIDRDGALAGRVAVAEDRLHLVPSRPSPTMSRRLPSPSRSRCMSCDACRR